MKIYSKLWGQNSNEEDIFIYTMENSFLKVEILNIGAIIKKIQLKNVKDINNNLKNIVLSYDNIEDYEKNPAYIGAVVGRTAGRIKNGILKIKDKEFILTQNNNKNNLHGGNNSISHKLWNIQIKEDRLSCYIESSHLENGFPGNIKIRLDYILRDNELLLEYYAETDAETYINLTNHSYFNLGPENSLIYDDVLKIDADYIIKLDANSIPYELLEIKDSIFDFKISKKIKNFFMGAHEQKNLANNGIDHPYILNKNSKIPIVIYNEKSKIKMEVQTNNPTAVVYTANWFSDIGFENHSGICFETQEAPNLFEDKKLALSPIFTDTNKPYKRYTKFKFYIL